MLGENGWFFEVRDNRENKNQHRSEEIRKKWVRYGFRHERTSQKVLDVSQGKNWAKLSTVYPVKSTPYPATLGKETKKPF